MSRNMHRLGLLDHTSISSYLSVIRRLFRYQQVSDGGVATEEVTTGGQGVKDVGEKGEEVEEKGRGGS